MPTGWVSKHKVSHKPFCLTDDFQVTVPSCSSVRSPWIRSSLRNSLPSFSRPTDFGSRRRLISLSRAAFSYSLTWSFTWEMASLISSRPCTRVPSSSVPAETKHKGQDILKQPLLHLCISEGSQSVLVVWRLCQHWVFCNERKPNNFKIARSTQPSRCSCTVLEKLKELVIQPDHYVLPSVFLMILSTRMGYFVMRWVTKRKHSGIPNLRTSGSWPIFCQTQSSSFCFFTSDILFFTQSTWL